MNCNKCMASLPDGAKFCNKCGEPVQETRAEPDRTKETPPAQAAAPACATCGAALLPNAKFCAKCGTVVARPEGNEWMATDQEAVPAASTPRAALSPEAPTARMAGARSEPSPSRPTSTFSQTAAPAAQRAAPDWVTDAMRKLQRIATFDATVYSELRADPQATAFSLMAAALGMFAFGLGGFLWTAIEFDGDWEVFWKSALMGTLLGVLLWLVWVIAAVGVLTYAFRETVRFDEVLRVAGGASATLALGFFMFVPGITFGVALVAVALWVATSIFALQSAFQLEPRRAVAANIAGFAVWALILPLIATANNPLGPGILLFDSIKDGMGDIFDAFSQFSR